MIWSIPTMWQFPELFLMFLPVTRHKYTSQVPDICFYRYFLRSGLWAWWAKLAFQVILLSADAWLHPLFWGSCLVGLNIHSDSSFVYGFMSLDYGLGTMTATTCTGLFARRVCSIAWSYTHPFLRWDCNRCWKIRRDRCFRRVGIRRWGWFIAVKEDNIRDFLKGRILSGSDFLPGRMFSVQGFLTGRMFSGPGFLIGSKTNRGNFCFHLKPCVS